MKLNLDNTLLLQANYSKLDKYNKYIASKYKFGHNFALETLPLEEGLLSIRGARQYGKSTWLENQLVKTIEEFGVGSALYLNGDLILDFKELVTELENLIIVLNKSKSKVKRIFIDEITAINHWQRAIKYLADRGELKGILIVATGSSAYDLRRATEKLPGRKGKHLQTEFIFPPISYAEFLKHLNSKGTNKDIKENPLIGYLISGGSPIALRELIENGKLPDELIVLTKDWIIGAVASADRSRQVLLGILNSVYKFAGTPVGFNKLAQESGLAGVANAQGYVEILTDCLALAPSYSWDVKREVSNRRKQTKFHFINLLVAVAFSKERVRSVSDFLALPETTQGKWQEWLVAQELFRKRVINATDSPEHFNHYNERDREVDFVLDAKNWLEVKRGQASPFEFNFIPEKVELKVISTNNIDLNKIKSLTLEDFMLDVG